MSSDQTDTAPGSDGRTEQITSGFPEAGPPRFDSIDAVRDGPRRRSDYLADDGIAGRRVPGRPAGQAGAGRGPGRDRQDRAGQVGGRAHREPPDPAPVLRGAGRVQGPLRVELQEAAPPHPGRLAVSRGRTLEEDIFSEEFLLTRPLLEAIRSTEPVVLLIDEVDRVELETEALLLEILSEYQVSIPELGTVTCHPDPAGVPHLQQHPRAVRGAEAPLPVPAHRLPRARARAGHRRAPGCPASARSWPTRSPGSCARSGTLDLKKAPSVSETLDWARTLVVLGVESIDAEQAKDTLHILLKYRSDIDRAAKELPAWTPTA